MEQAQQRRSFRSALSLERRSKKSTATKSSTSSSGFGRLRGLVPFGRKANASAPDVKVPVLNALAEEESTPRPAARGSVSARLEKSAGESSAPTVRSSPASSSDGTAATLSASVHRAESPKPATPLAAESPAVAPAEPRPVRIEPSSESIARKRLSAPTLKRSDYKAAEIVVDLHTPSATPSAQRLQQPLTPPSLPPPSLKPPPGECLAAASTFASSAASTAAPLFYRSTIIPASGPGPRPFTRSSYRLSSTQSSSHSSSYSHSSQSFYFRRCYLLNAPPAVAVVVAAAPALKASPLSQPPGVAVASRPERRGPALLVKAAEQQPPAGVWPANNQRRQSLPAAIAPPVLIGHPPRPPQPQQPCAAAVIRAAAPVPRSQPQPPPLLQYPKVFVAQPPADPRPRRYSLGAGSALPLLPTRETPQFALKTVRDASCILPDELQAQPADLRFNRKLGQGGAATVWQAQWRGISVAVKILHGGGGGLTEQRALLQELKIWARLRHPNVVLLMGASLLHRPSFLVSEFCGGGSLFAVLHELRTPLTMLQRLKIAADVARGCLYLHTAEPPIIHRDLKSLNILLADEYAGPNSVVVAKIADFGLSSITKSSPSPAASNVANAWNGTTYWMAPELFGLQTPTTASDVFAFAVVMFELLANRLPYEGKSMSQVVCMNNVMQGLRPDLSLIPRSSTAAHSAVALIEDCWQKDPRRRPRFAEILDRLEIIAGQV